MVKSPRGHPQATRSRTQTEAGVSLVFHPVRHKYGAQPSCSHSWVVALYLKADVQLVALCERGDPVVRPAKLALYGGASAACSM